MSQPQYSDLDTRAELEKLCQLLDLSDERVRPLAVAGGDGMRRFRQQIQKTVFDYRRDGFRSLAKWVRLLPKGYLARLAERALGPRLTARLAGELDPYHAFKIAKRLPPEFLADVAVQVDPDRAREIITQLPAELIRDVALILVRREDYITLGRLADALRPPAIRAVVNAVHDDAVLLKIAFKVEDPAQLSKIVYMIDNKRVASVIRTGTEKALWPQALYVVDNVEDELKGRLANIMGEQDATVLDDLVLVAYRQNLWAPVLRGMARMNPKYYQKIVNLPAVKDAELLGDLIRSAREYDLLEAALPLAKFMQPEFQRVVAHAALRQGEATAEAVLWAAYNTGEWETILQLAGYLEGAERDVIASLPITEDKRVLRQLIATAVQVERTELLLDFVTRMPPDSRSAAAEVVLEDDGELLAALLDTVREGGHWDAAAILVGSLDDEGIEQAGRVLRRLDEREQADFAAAARRQEGLWERIAPGLEAPPA